MNAWLIFGLLALSLMGSCYFPQVYRRKGILAFRYAIASGLSWFGLAFTFYLLVTP